MKITPKAICSLAVLAVLILIGKVAQAQVYLGDTIEKVQAPTAKTVEEAAASLPLLKKIPTSFVVGDGFKFKLSGLSLRIDHMGTNSRAPVQKRNCLVSLSYSAPVSFFGSRVEVPLLFSEQVASGWGVNTLGDYVVNLSKEAPSDRPVMGLTLSARF